MAFITLQETLSLEAGNLFRVLEEITVAAGISDSVFVFTTGTQEFSRVATVYDLESLLDTSYEDAVAHASEYYRLTTVQKDFITQAKAQAFSAYTRARIRTLVDDYTEYTDGFEDVTIYEYGEAPPAEPGAV